MDPRGYNRLNVYDRVRTGHENWRYGGRDAAEWQQRAHEHGKSRAISSARLWRRRLYTCALSMSSSLTALKGNLILRPASRLDAFSAYPIPTWVPGRAPGGTTGAPEVGPPRSSRTSGRAAQISCAHDR